MLWRLDTAHLIIVIRASFGALGCILQRASEGRDLMMRTEIEREIAVLPGE